MKRIRILLSFLLVSGFGGHPSSAVEVLRYPLLNEFIKDMVRKHNFSNEELVRLFTRVELRPNVVEAMRRPAEALPWFQYRKLFVTEQNIENGLAFVNRHREVLARAEREFGVPSEIIVAIIGVETQYGVQMGTYPVLESLTTLILGYPRRSAFFKSELEQFLLLSREEGLDPLTTKGSYAGAMGVPQFIASSYRQYAIDFNGDQRRDLITQPADAIGSVANYLRKHRWRAAEPVMVEPIVKSAEAIGDKVSTRLKPTLTLRELKAAGVSSPIDLKRDTRVGLVRLDNGADGNHYRLTFDNFYVITKYNRSINYAMAVYDLSQRIARRRSRS